MSDVVDPGPAAGYLPHNPLIKRLLRNYQETAERSLEGPRTDTCCMPADDDDAVDEGTAEAGVGGLSVDDGRLSGSLLVRLRADPHRRLDATLEGERISCFVVGGERRLCVPQMLNTVLSRFSLPEIHAACDCLRIHIALADDRQLGVLRRDGVLPRTAHGCGLVTLTDAQRLCCALLGNYRARRAPTAPGVDVDARGDLLIPVMHRCFGKCAGSLRPSTRLVRCAECYHEFDVEPFVAHSHGHQESRTCHWGFDAANWRAYLQLATDDDDRLQNCLDYFKDHADTVAVTGYRKRREVGHLTTGHANALTPCSGGF